ncbi:MAG: amidase [Rhodospirillales bacterium]|nr:amidase [Alphaproteobacteria bacterium]MBL6947130.1 amidase [Rhodospirillales bacterium]
MRELSSPLPFERQPPKFLERLESLAPGTGPADKGPDTASTSSPGGEITGLSLTDVAAAIAGKHLSSEETTRACLERIEALGETLNCIAGIDADAAIADARKADEKMANGEALGPLSGVPLAHKDMFYRAGRESACGSNIRKGFIPDHTSGALERLDAAGALDIARLNMVEFAIGVTGHNEITGPVRNPWNTNYMTGGSSSGSGAAVAAGLAFGALGSDTGGSIRFPASCCGVVGLKPTYGRVSRHGAMPLSYSLDTVGPLTRTVADNALMFQAVAGHDTRDAASSSLDAPDVMSGLEAGVRGLRMAIAENYFFEPLNDEMRRLMDAAIDVLSDLGADVVPVTVPESVSATNGLTSLITSTEGATLHASWMRDRAGDYGRQTLGRLAAGALTPATTYLDVLNLRQGILEDFMDAVFEKADVLLTPVMMMPVPTIEESDLAANPGFSEFIVAMGHATRPFNYLGLPGLSVPCGFTDNGLPAAIQLVGRPFDEATLYRTARAYERETGCTTKRPSI